MGKCKKRGAVITVGNLLLCKEHFKKAQGKIQNMGVMGMLCAPTLTKDAILALANQ